VIKDVIKLGNNVIYSAEKESGSEELIMQVSLLEGEDSNTNNKINVFLIFYPFVFF
jgi:hypothetical protein